MMCTPEEIAEKRRKAIERLNARKNSNLVPQVSTSVLQKPQNQALMPAAKFYSNNNNKPSSPATSNNDSRKMSNSFNNARDLSHPYKKSPAPSSTANNFVVFSKVINCTTSMVSETKFGVTMSGYSEKLIEMFKTIPSKTYDPSSKLWSFNINDYELLMQKAKELKSEAIISPLPKFILQVFQEPKKPLSTMCLKIIEPTIANKLLPFQREGVCFGIEKQGRALIGDEMGLGKTYQALAIMDFYKGDWPLLICTTSSTKDNWAQKIRELLPYVPCSRIMVLQTKKDVIGPEIKIVIVNNTVLESVCDKLMQKNFGCIIFDESQILKNFKTKIAVTAQQLAKNAKRIVLLSGTPALSRPSELFTQLEILEPYFFNFKEYSTRYCAAKQSNFGWDASGQSNLQELGLLLNRKFMIRRIKAEVMQELTEKNRETIILDPALIWTHDETDENLSIYKQDYENFKGSAKDELLLKFYSITAEAKKKAVCDYVKKVLKENTKFIIFAHHGVMLDAICQCLNKKKVEHIRIDGSTKATLRTEYIDRFQKQESCRAGVLSLKACSAGITLTAAHLVLFAELDWNPSTLAQAESRVHRIGQDKDVVIRYLLAPGTADDVIWQMLNKKQTTLTKVGLFNDDLSDATHSAVPSSAGNIEKYLEPRGPFDKYLTKASNSDSSNLSSSSFVTAKSSLDQTNNNVSSSENVDYQKLMEDDEDDLFLSLTDNGEYLG